MNYLVRKVIAYIVVLLVVAQLDFFLPRIAPGDPAAIIVAGASTGLASQEKIAKVAALLGLHQPLSTQYYLYLKNVFATWPPYFGVSYQYFPVPVSQLFFNRVGWTLLLILSGMGIALLISVSLSAFTSLRRGGKAEVASTYSSIIFQATPIYWTGIVLLWIFGATLHWFPVFGNVAPNLSSGWAYYQSIIWHSVLPVVAMAASMFGEIYLLVRGTTQEALKSDYIFAARTRGLRDRAIAFSYILRNSMLPLVSVLSFSFASLISRAVLIEAVFGYAGVGDLFVDAVVNHDYPVLEGTLFLVTIIIIIGGLIGDVLLVRLDPRLRSGKGE